MRSKLQLQKHKEVEQINKLFLKQHLSANHGLMSKYHNTEHKIILKRSGWSKGLHTQQYTPWPTMSNVNDSLNVSINKVTKACQWLRILHNTDKVPDNMSNKHDQLLAIIDPRRVNLGHQPCYSPKSLQTLAHFIICTFHKCFGEAAQSQLLINSLGQLAGLLGSPSLRFFNCCGLQK